MHSDWPADNSDHIYKKTEVRFGRLDESFVQVTDNKQRISEWMNE